MKRKIRKIIVHCSASRFGTALVIDDWHRERGFDCVGYHYIVQNGFPFNSKDRHSILDGHIEPGRPEQKVGAHCRGHNSDSIGICLIGDDDFTPPQQVSLRALIKKLMHDHGLSASDVLCHNELDPKKTCPNFSGEQLRDFIRNQSQTLGG